MHNRGRAGALDELTLAMQAALRVVDVQSNYLEAVSGVVDADAYGFSHFDVLGQRLMPLSVATRQAPHRLVPDYNELGADQDPILAAALSVNAPVDSSRLLQGDAWREQSLYVLLDRHGLHHSMVVPLLGCDSRLLGALYLARSDDCPAFSPGDIACMTRAKQHVELALHRAIRHESADQRGSMLGWAMNQLDTATIVSTVDGQTYFENQALRRLLRAQRSAGPVVAELVAGNLGRLRRGPQRVVITASPLASGGNEPGADEGEADLRLTVKTVALRPGQSTAVSFVFLQRKNVAAPVDHAPLSAREREIVAWVAEGLTNRQISELAFVSENTVRQHLKRVFRKLNVHSRAELVQAVWQGADDLP
ncbi:helix-turn-helix transcriptional regulator [Streptomyces sp. Li-HN-5-11]|uniref:helix-turn-helix transcriptional regulator n=1 Tax=Streptomyces sp. Li-HN-5-11 TaxID=3075432 RepID=UPI0028ABAF8C|nr:helix-turn-helix transcriptional regulator [Streptomyces sp. Li-HN-5-11]WNM35717.1 helix-turn-helix transcriptional regulator [Streptomyces sp. Li-HN-5-11]